MFPSLIPLQMPRLFLWILEDPTLAWPPGLCTCQHSLSPCVVVQMGTPGDEMLMLFLPCSSRKKSTQQWDSLWSLSGPQHPQGATELFSALTNQVAFCSELEKSKQAGHSVSCSCSSGGHTLFLGFVLC